MQSLKKLINRAFLSFFILSGLLTGYILNFSSIAHAQLNAQQEAELRESIKNCPTAIRQNMEQVIASGHVDYLNGTYITSQGGVTATFSGCADGSAFSKLFIRIIVILVSIVGAVFAFSAGKAAILMIIAFDNTEAFQEAVGGLKTSIISIFGVLFSYIAIVFLLTGVFGLGTSKDHEWDLVCGQRIAFQVTFGDADNPVDPCV